MGRKRAHLRHSPRAHHRYRGVASRRWRRAPAFGSRRVRRAHGTGHPDIHAAQWDARRRAGATRTSAARGLHDGLRIRCFESSVFDPQTERRAALLAAHRNRCRAEAVSVTPPIRLLPYAGQPISNSSSRLKRLAWGGESRAAPFSRGRSCGFAPPRGGCPWTPRAGSTASPGRPEWPSRRLI